MRRSKVDIQSATAEIRRGKKKEEEETGPKYNVCICYAGRPQTIDYIYLQLSYYYYHYSCYYYNYCYCFQFWLERPTFLYVVPPKKFLKNYDENIGEKHC